MAWGLLRCSPCISPCHGPRSLAFPFIYEGTNLQGVGEELVHLGDLGRDGEVDGPVANLNNQSSNDLRVDLCLLVSCVYRQRTSAREDSYLVGDLELLALADVRGLGHSALEPVQGLVVQRLWSVVVSDIFSFQKNCLSCRQPISSACQSFPTIPSASSSASRSLSLSGDGGWGAHVPQRS